MPTAVISAPRHLGALSWREHSEVLQAQSLLMSHLDGLGGGVVTNYERPLICACHPSPLFHSVQTVDILPSFLPRAFGASGPLHTLLSLP